MKLELSQSRFATWLYRSSLGTKLNALVFAILIPAFVFAIIFTFSTLELQRYALQTTEYRKILLNLSELKSSLLNIQTGLRGFALTASKEFLVPYTLGLENSLLILSDLQKSKVSESELLALRKEILAYQVWIKPQLKLDNSMLQSKKTIIWQEGRVRFDTLRLALDNLVVNTDVSFAKARTGTYNSIEFLLWFPWLLFIFLFIGNLIWRWGIRNFILQPLKVIESTVKTQALEAGLMTISKVSQDEIGQLSNSLNASYEALRIRTQDLILSNINLEVGRKQLEMNSELAVSAARMVAWDWKILTDTVSLSSNTETILGAKALTWTTSQPCMAAIHQEDILAHLEIIAKTLVSRDSYRSAYRIWNDTKQAYIWMEEFGTVRLDHDHNIIALNGVTQDITERKNIDLALRRINEAQKRFVGDAAHELRAPLTSIQGNLELLRRYPDMSNEDRKETIADAYHETARLGRLVADLLALARGDAGEGLRLEPMQLQEVLTDTIRQAKHLATNHQLEYNEFKTCTVEGDHDRLKQLLLILLENAIKYTPKEGQIECSLECDQDWAEIRIKDTGMGIAPEDIPFVFERFYRADKARTRGTDPGGTGLGLPIAQWIVAQHGGEIRLESQVGIGTTAILRLPIAQ